MADSSVPRLTSFALEAVEDGFYDFVLDGTKLQKLIYGSDYDGASGVEVTLLSARHALTWGEEQTRQLLGELPGEFSADRVWLYACPACLDASCGGISVAIDFVDDCVVWRDFAYDFGEPLEPDDFVEGLGPFTFNRDQYATTLRDLLQQLQEEHRAEAQRNAVSYLKRKSRLALWRHPFGRHRLNGS